MKITVKTIDSGSQEFELSDEETVEGLKDEILKKMGIPLDQQRLIFQGKVLKDGQQLKTYGVHDKVLHLVKRPPPSLTGSQGAAGSQSTAPPMSGAGPGPPPGMTVQATQDVVIMGNIPVSSHSDITQVTQNIVDQIVNSLSSQGAQAQVSAETITTDMSGTMRTTTVSAKSDPNRSSEPRAAPTASSGANVAAAPPPVPQPAKTPDSTHAKPETTSKQPLKDEPPPLSRPPGSGGARGRSLREEAEEHEADMRRREAERNQRQLVTILNHARTVKRCLDMATRVLDRYDRAAARALARQRLAALMSGRGLEVEEDKEKDEGEEWGAVEPMEGLEGGGAADGKGEGAAGEGGKTGEGAKESDKGGSETTPTGAGSTDDRYKELDQSRDNPTNLSSMLYSHFLDDIAALQRRVHPCVVKYRRNIANSVQLSDSDAMVATREALTVKDFNYYIGHAYVSLSRLHVNMMATPPRTIRLTAPRRTEMRRMMTQFRNDPLPRSDIPSGYIVDISRDDEEGEGGERRSTRAIVNRTAGRGGTEGREGGGRRGGARSNAPRPPPMSMENLFPPGLGFAEFMAARRDKKETEERRKKEEEEKGRGGATASVGGGATSAGGGSSAGPSREGGEGGSGAGKMETQPGDEVRSKHSGQAPSGGVVAGDGEEVRSKRAPPEDPAKASNKKGEGSERREGADGDSDSDGETPQYLARLLSELITGVADPAGPHRPSRTKPEEEEGGEGGGAKDNSDTAPPKEKEAEEGEKKEEGGHPRTFAERYAGPEGTTVTISAAPAPPFGIAGLPPMEGPSLSIKNRGDGAEPEMTINFPMPPAIQLLQSLLERAEERHQQRREAGETSSEESSEEEEGEGAKGEGEGEGGAAKKKKKEKGKKQEKAFLDEDGELKSISDAGSIDDIDSDHEDPPEFENPMTQMAASAMSTLHTGEHVSMLDTMAEVRSHLGAPPDMDTEDDSDLGMVEQILKVVSRELSVVEVMQVFKGEVAPAERLQPCLYNWVREKLLKGAVPTPGRRQEAVEAFLEHCKPTLEMHEFPVRDKNIDLPNTLYKMLFGILEDAYDRIITECTQSEKERGVFSSTMHSWAVQSSSLFSNMIRHLVDQDDLFEVMVNKIIECLFPPNTPSVILSMCGDSILKELDRSRKQRPLTPAELDRYVVWKDGTTPTPNASMPLSQYSTEGGSTHPGQALPRPVQESCPGAPPTQPPPELPSPDAFPPGIPEEWVSAIKRDSATANATSGPQSPYSQAYLAGMPAKRRKLDTSEARTVTEQDLVLDLAAEALIKTGVRPKDGKSQLELLSYIHHNEEAGTGVRSDMYDIQRERFSGQADFDSEHHPNIANLYDLKGEKKEEK